MGHNIDCLRCGKQMSHIGTEKIQLGQTGWIFGDLSNLLAGAMEVDIYCCPECRKLEFFQQMPLKKDYHRRCVRNVARCMILIIPNARSVNMITRVRWVFDKFQFGRYSLAIYLSLVLAATECSHGRLRAHRETPGEGLPR